MTTSDSTKVIHQRDGREGQIENVFDSDSQNQLVTWADGTKECISNARFTIIHGGKALGIDAPV